MYSLCSQHLQSFNSEQQKLSVLQPLKDMFQMRLPALQADLDLTWSPHSSDLNYSDFYLWGYFKVRVYEHNFQTIPDLKAAIRAERGGQEGHWKFCQANSSLPAMPGLNLEQILERL